MGAFLPHPPIQRTFNILLFVGFLAGIWAPLVTMLVRDHSDSAADAIENRARIQVPAWQWTGEGIRSFPARFERYADNEFGLRDTLIRWHSRLAVSVFNMSPSPKVRLGREGWLYFDGDEANQDYSPIQDYTGLHPLPPEQLEALRFLYQDQSDYLRSHGIRYLLVLVPTKPFIHPEFLPSNVIRARDTAWRSQLVTYLRTHTDVDVLDLAPALLAARETEPLFFKTDTHWNPIGGFLASHAIVRALQPWFPQLTPIPESAYHRQPDVPKQGDLGRMMNLSDSFEERFVTLVPGPQTRGTNQVLSEARFAPIVGGNGDPAYPTAQVYRDSYGDYLVPFLSEYFSRVEYEWGQKGTRMAGIEETGPDVVLQVSCDRILNGPLLIAPRIREHASRQRFDRGRVIARYTPEDGFQGLEAWHRTDARPVIDGMALTSPGGPIRVAMPLDLDPRVEVPILRLEIRPRATGSISVTYPRQPMARGKRPPETTLGRVRLESGRNIIHLTLSDPGIRDHVTLDFGTGTGGYLLHAVELRAVPRLGAD